MRLSAKARRAPGRLATGSYILNSGLGKLSIEDQTAAGLPAMATAGYLTRCGATAAGSTDGSSGPDLAACSGGLLGLYLRSPGMRGEGACYPRKTAWTWRKTA